MNSLRQTTEPITTRTEVASEELVKETVHWVPRLGVGFLIVIAFFVMAALISKILERSIRRSAPTRRAIMALLIRVGRNVLVLIGVTVALGTMGINVSAIVAGLGLTGFALGFALKDAISNIISGVVILLYHTFQVGDYVTTSGFEGKVIDIDLRYTILLKDDKKILIPNSLLVTNPIVIQEMPTPVKKSLP